MNSTPLGSKDGEMASQGGRQPVQPSLLDVQEPGPQPRRTDPSSGHPRSVREGGGTSRHPRRRHSPLLPYLDVRRRSVWLHLDCPHPDPNSFLNSLLQSLKLRARAPASSAVAHKRSHDAPPRSPPLWSCDLQGIQRRKPGSRPLAIGGCR